MAARNWLLAVVGILLALWMGAGRWLFGIGGELTWWYVPAITLPYIWLQLWFIRRLRIAARRGRRVRRAPYVSLLLSWACAIGFGLTVPDMVDGHLETLMSHWFGQGWFEMAVALCNPLGIIAFAMMIAAVSFAAAQGREPRPSEDELIDAAGDAPQMVQHPLAE